MEQKTDRHWIQQGILHGAIKECKSKTYGSIFNLLTDRTNLEWIQRNAVGLIGKSYFLKKSHQNKLILIPHFYMNFVKKAVTTFICLSLFFFLVACLLFRNPVK